MNKIEIDSIKIVCYYLVMVIWLNYLYLIFVNVFKMDEVWKYKFDYYIWIWKIEVKVNFYWKMFNCSIVIKIYYNYFLCLLSEEIVFRKEMWYFDWVF